ncbi:hypothetical protein PHLGIDRAFT_113364 [Phlebiopsis gigantea 11061_1 CR5-6]|uniref:Guanylate-binding protein N-terminal domain-containing protein n=1 Tax=Phlebiopsis gigantea (strain 11061_1 CR5-6) TaxID=745531 RepID=A0A0C3S829_PHLG1|nr:hypothetical protein PHLGIDRAFT_113364 [Phlebiopsis gigantea 11061_1 CR5-6]
MSPASRKKAKKERNRKGKGTSTPSTAAREDDGRKASSLQTVNADLGASPSSSDRDLSASPITPSTGALTPEDVVMEDQTHPGGSSNPAQNGASSHDNDTTSPTEGFASEDHTAANTMDLGASVDLVNSIDGMYRILDPVIEQSSSGLVDKIIICQDSFGRFVNDTCSGAYQSMTHVNFAALDQLSIHPIGIYGSKSEIVRYLRDLDMIDDDTALLLRKGKDDMPNSQTLRTGLYLLRDASLSVVYVIFWPQDTTWSDDCISSVKRNRVTFMRYLTKIADQIVALISDEHADAIVWGSNDSKPSHDDDMEALDDLENVDRLYTFEVSKTKEQEENVTSSPGFNITNERVAIHELPDDPSVTPDMLAPRLVGGDSALGVMTVEESGSFTMNDSLSEETLELLRIAGLSKHVPEAWTVLQTQRQTSAQQTQVEEQKVLAQLEASLRDEHDLVRAALLWEAANDVVEKFPTFTHEELIQPPQSEDAVRQGRALLDNLCAMHHSVASERKQLCSNSKLRGLKAKEFTTRKEHILQLVDLLDKSPDMPTDTQHMLILEVLESPISSAAQPPSRKLLSKLSDTVLSFIPGNVFGGESRDQRIAPVKDEDFIAMIPSLTEKHPVLVETVSEAVAMARAQFTGHIHKEVHRVVRNIEEARRSTCKTHLKPRSEAKKKGDLDESRRCFFQGIKDRFLRDKEHYLEISAVRPERNYGYWNKGNARIIGTQRWKSAATLRYKIHPLQLTEGDRHSMQLDPSHVPTPRHAAAAAHNFQLAAEQCLLYFQMLQNDKCLVIITGENGSVDVYLERFSDIDNAIQRHQTKKHLNQDRLGSRFLLAYDESKRMLAVFAVDKLQLHVLVFDEHFKSLQLLGNIIELRAWYDQQVSFTFLVFRSGPSEDLLIVEDGGHARLFSIITQQFRPSSLQFTFQPTAILSSPDGSAFITVQTNSDVTALQAYHWASFGNSDGISIEAPEQPLTHLVLTSFVDKSSCHLVGMDRASRSIRSTALHITHKSTEFTFQENGRRRQNRSSDVTTVHNSLVDCHCEVWTRFPVVPAVRRHTFKSSQRATRSITFVSHHSPDLYRRYFSDLISSFVKSTRKPVGRELSGIIVNALPYPAFMKGVGVETSEFRAGEWLVDLLCLIPIHIAVAQNDRFVPLKDGVHSPEFERTLLGATVEQVTDRLSFGWYESIFASYMANKPVRVVSSMGEQSVGKSFALNHLVDTSFAGSAMRTTEGVWMSVTPTDDMLIVALDFEGVHSLERSVQEDSLLVLFNTAISNLVLFRNNFAMSRDITNLFQSFQSSAMVLDPAANPSLFKSRLVIVVKDVVNSDEREIMKEFSVKFQQIVAVEQESNFLTRLHEGQLAIMPWPVIESRQFYVLFGAVKKMLDEQPVTHGKAGVFLQIMKTLMAKLKTNDWGSLDQNLAMHRAQLLQTMLPLAFKYGAIEPEPNYEALKDIDNGADLNSPAVSRNLHFYVPLNPSADDNTEEQTVTDRAALLHTVISSYRGGARDAALNDSEWIDELDDYLLHCIQSRIEYVQHWLDINTSRFQTDITTFQGLRREFEASVVMLKASADTMKAFTTAVRRMFALAVANSSMNIWVMVSPVVYHHTQLEHETSHGSMSRTRWAVEGSDDPVVVVNGRKFGANDDGAPLLCSMICKEQGRHVHIDWCQTQQDEVCSGAGFQHIDTLIQPQPTRAKDFVAHDLYWRRTGFKDPYSQESRIEFSKCDAMCPGKEHEADASGQAHPSYCTLPIFHEPADAEDEAATGYTSGDGHHFSCRNPALLQQAFHVIFVIDRSGSMGLQDRQPLRNTPVTGRIAVRHNDRLGAVYSSLYAFWTARHGALGSAANRRDSYSVILFDHDLDTPVTNDFQSTPDQLLNLVLQHESRGGTDYTMALAAARSCMENNWSTERQVSLSQYLIRALMVAIAHL